MKVIFDEEVGTLYVRRPAAEVRTSEAAPHDGLLIFDMGEDGSVVGMIVCGADELDPGYWLNEHPDRDQVPADLREEIDSWFSQRASPPSC
jgi:uncharacterized protein YuzE